MTRHALAVVVALIGVGLALFGVMRGLAKTGPASGTRMIVEIAPPVDTDSFALAEHVVRARVEEPGDDTLVVPAGERIVVEVEHDPADTAALLERTAKLEIKNGDQVILDGSAIARAGVVEHGVAVATRGPFAARIGDKLAFVLDGKVKQVAEVDHADPNAFHVVVADVDAAMDLVEVIDAGAAHPMHVTRREPFRRAVGFFPRGWPFFAAGGALVLVAVAFAFLRGPRKPA